ncbi:hypothetical protein EDD21DRAFT_406353 [Dissophora ornata]|nr:hypothetical protein EDD21DRAFT_406353 [Dissophora ornata]
MTQQVDPKNSSTAHPGQTEAPTAFAFESHRGSGGDSGGDSGSGNGGSSSNATDRWPSLLYIRQVLAAFFVEVVSTSKPLRNKLNVVVVQAWHQYLSCVQDYPLLTIFLSSLVLLSSGPIIIFACVTSVSLGFLLGAAVVFVIMIQSIVVSIAGAILLFVLGTILVMTVFTFFWLVVAYVGFNFARNFALVLQTQHRHLRQQQQQQQQQHHPQSGSI